MLLYAIKKS